VFEINPVTHHAGRINTHSRSEKAAWVPPRSVKLLDQVRERIRYLCYGPQAVRADVY